MTVVVASVNLAQGLALREDDVLGDMRSFLDAYGEDCEREDAVVAIVQWRDTRGWTPVRIEDFENTRSC